MSELFSSLRQPSSPVQARSTRPADVDDHAADQTPAAPTPTETSPAARRPVRTQRQARERRAHGELLQRARVTTALAATAATTTSPQVPQTQARSSSPGAFIGTSWRTEMQTRGIEGFCQFVGPALARQILAGATSEVQGVIREIALLRSQNRNREADELLWSMRQSPGFAAATQLAHHLARFPGANRDAAQQFLALQASPGQPLHPNAWLTWSAQPPQGPIGEAMNPTSPSLPITVPANDRPRPLDVPAARREQLRQLTACFRALQMANMFGNPHRVNRAAVEARLRQILATPAGQQTMRDMQRHAIQERVGVQGAQRLAQQQANYLLSDQFQQRLKFEGPQALARELEMLRTLNPSLAADVQGKLFARSIESDAAGIIAGPNVTAEQRREAIAKVLQGVPGFAALPQQERDALVVFLGDRPSEWSGNSSSAASLMNSAVSLTTGQRNVLQNLGPAIGNGGRFASLVASALVLGSAFTEGLGNAAQHIGTLLQATSDFSGQLGALLNRQFPRLSAQAATYALRVAGPASTLMSSFLAADQAHQLWMRGDSTAARFHELASFAYIGSAGLGILGLFGAANAWNPIGWGALALFGTGVVLQLLGNNAANDPQRFLQDHGFDTPGTNSHPVGGLPIGG